VANRPVLEYVIEQMREIGVDEVICITGHLSGLIEEYLDTEHPDLKTRYVEQVEQLGTADAIRLAEPFVKGPVLIVFVDTLFDADFGIIRQRPEDDGIIWAKEVEDYQRFGVIVTDENGYMQRIVEKPSEPISRLANIGVYYVRDSQLMFEGIYEIMGRDPHLGEYFLTDAFQYMIDHGSKLFTAEVEGWYDCGKPQTVLDTNRVLLERGYEQQPASPPEGVRFIDPVCIAETVRLEASVIGPNVSIADGSAVTGSRLRDCIVGEHSSLASCDLRESLVGDYVVLDGVTGQVSVGDHSEIHSDHS
jgi:glucose-1-phosphate thymidylyltransferase